MLGQHADGRTDLARGAVAALEAVVRHEGGLHGVQSVRPAQALDGGDRVALVHDGEGQAADDAQSVHQHGAGPALTMVAALLRTREAEMLTQRIQQRRAGVDRKGVNDPVNVQGDLRHDGRSGIPSYVAGLHGGASRCIQLLAF